MAVANDVLMAPAVCAALFIIWPLEALLKWVALLYRIVTGREP